MQKDTKSDKTAMQQLIEAMVSVMSEVQYLRKDDTVGTGNSSYKGLTDEKVREEVRKSLIKHGINIIQSKVTTTVRVDRWEEADPYSKTGGMKTKQQVFTEAIVDYDIYHVSGACISGQSIGHGIDSQDKGPGKAMTYAYKNFLLNCFCIPSGEDNDKVHSDTIEIPPVAGSVTIAHIKANLFNGGRILPTDLDKVIKAWKATSGEFYHGSYVKTVSTETGKEFWFLLSDEQLKAFKAAKNG